MAFIAIVPAAICLFECAALKVALFISDAHHEVWRSCLPHLSTFMLQDEDILSKDALQGFLLGFLALLGRCRQLLPTPKQVRWPATFCQISGGDCMPFCLADSACKKHVLGINSVDVRSPAIKYFRNVRWRKPQRAAIPSEGTKDGQYHAKASGSHISGANLHLNNIFWGFRTTKPLQ